MILKETQLVLGRGEVYFEPFLEGTRVGEGERYIGNTTTFQLSRTIGRLERFTSYKGRRVEREGAVTDESHMVQFVTDNISIENVSSWFGEEDGETTFNAISFITEEFRVKQDRFYQLGKTFFPSLGARHVENISVKLNNVSIPASGNWDVDKSLGRMQILPGAPDLPDGSIVVVTFEWRTVKSGYATSHSRDLFGSMRFIATNPVGIKRNYFFPFVRLSPRGAVDLKGDEWQQMPFEAEAMRLTPTTEQVYLDGVTFVGKTYDEDGIIDEGLSNVEFLYWEDQLDIITNIDLPAIGLDVPIAYP